MNAMIERKNEPVPTSWPLAALWAALTFVVRVVPIAPNFAAVGALSLYGGARMPWWAAFALPLGTMAASDVVLGYMRDYHAFNPYVYGCFAVAVLLGMLLRRTNSIVRIGAAAVASDALFFVVTNFGVWQGDHGQAYARSFDGLMQCYAAAIPFMQNTVISTLVFVPLFFGVHTLVTKAAPIGEPAESRV